MADAAKAVNIAKDAEAPVIIYGPEGAEAAQSLADSLPNAKTLAFSPGGNTLGIASAGVDVSFAGQEAAAYFVMAGETEPGRVSSQLLDSLGGADFVVVQSCFVEPWDGVADVILPAQNMYEKSGTITNAEGHEAAVVAGKQTRVLSDAAVIEQLCSLI